MKGTYIVLLALAAGIGLGTWAAASSPAASGAHTSKIAYIRVVPNRSS